MGESLRIGIILLLVALGNNAGAHGGGLNGDGCHTNRKTGDYHCHRPQRTAKRSGEYCRATPEGALNCGYTLETCLDLVGEFGGECLAKR